MSTASLPRIQRARPLLPCRRLLPGILPFGSSAGVCKAWLHLHHGRTRGAGAHACVRARALGRGEVALRCAIVNLVERHLNFLNGFEPPPYHAPHRIHQRAIAERLVLRRKACNSASSTSPRKFEEVQKKVNLLHDLLQGDWSHDEIVHFCRGERCVCGGSAEAAKRMIVEILAWLVVTSMPASPSFSRWTTLGPAMAWMGAARMVHRLLPRAWLSAFGSKAPGLDCSTVGVDGPDDGAVEDFAKQLGRRTAKAPSPRKAHANISESG